MPTVKYYSRSIKYVPSADATKKRERVEVIQRLAAKVKNVEDIADIAAKKSFIRWCTGGFTLDEIIKRRKAEGRSDWYV